MEGTFVRSFLIIFWWIAIWGLVETLVEMFVKNALVGRLIFYSGMIIVVVGTVLLNPHYLDHI